MLVISTDYFFSTKSPYGTYTLNNDKFIVAQWNIFEPLIRFSSEVTICFTYSKNSIGPSQFRVIREHETFGNPNYNISGMQFYRTVQ